MALKVLPSNILESIYVGEDVKYRLSVVDHLGDDSIRSIAVAYKDSNGLPVTTNFSKGSAFSLGIISFGLTAFQAGTVAIHIDVICNQKLPDGITYRNFKIKLYLPILDININN